MLNVSTRALIEDDLPHLEEILRSHVRDLHTGEVVESEVQAIMGYMRGAIDAEGRVRNYLVACDDKGNIVGCIAVSSPDAQMSAHFDTASAESIEILNFFVSAAFLRTYGVGRKLFESACVYGVSKAARYLLVNSGPRYVSSWGFYDRVCDSRQGLIEHKYGNGRHAMTWRKLL
jgi:predicted N-acetyltransferase YhbS